MIHIWLPLWEGVEAMGGGSKGKKRCYGTYGVGKGGGVSESSGRLIIIFFIKENWILVMTRHHANNILLRKNLHFDSEVRQWSHPLKILLHFLWAKSNYRTRGQFECDRALFYLWFCLFTCTMRLLFLSLFTFPRLSNKTGWLQNEY